VLIFNIKDKPMPVSVNWYDEVQRIMLYRLIGDWTLAENTEASSLSYQLSQQITGRFDIIVDSIESTYVPPVGVLWDWKQSAMFRDSTFPNWGLTIIVSITKIGNAFFEEGIQTSDVIRKHFCLATSIKEALEIIHTDRANS
jgi:hypothetical protein